MRTKYFKIFIQTEGALQSVKRMLVLCVQCSNYVWYWFGVTRSHHMEDIEKTATIFLTKYLCRKSDYTANYTFTTMSVSIFSNIWNFLVLKTPWHHCFLACPSLTPWIHFKLLWRYLDRLVSSPAIWSS